MRTPWKRLDAAQVNGMSVALGVALLQALLTALFGLSPGLAAAGGAVCTSLPDVPNPPQRVLRRVLPAALIASLVTLLVGLCRGTPGLMVLLVGCTGFFTLMAMAWGPRAGPLSFSGIMALVFAMAWVAPARPVDALVHAGWVLLGALLYAGWASASAWVLRRRYRELALAEAMRACARRLRSRVLRITDQIPPEEASIRLSIADDVLLADALQNARDQVFAARMSPHSRRQVDLLLRLIELRDLLLASRLDVHLLGDDAAGMHWRQGLAASLSELADALDALALAVGEGAPVPALSAPRWRAELSQRLVGAEAPPEDPRHHLQHALQTRVGHMLDDVAAMAERLQGPDREIALSAHELRQFASPEGWPLAALRPHLNLQSSVLRHALRSALALSAAYGLGLLLPWAAHPHWLVLSVAVVLRGNLEQTLSRRNERIIGTVIGCLLVLGIAHLPREAHLLQALCFITAVGVAHAYLNKLYRVAAAAATLMALLQPLLLAPGTPPAIVERLADTVLGALLAWAFCFVLPSWEHRSVQRFGEQLLRTLSRHAVNVLRWAPGPQQQLAQRLSRQQAYAALAALAAVAQRTRVEPEHVRVPEARLEAVLSHGYRFMALMGAVQQMLSRRIDHLDAGQSAPALEAAASDCKAILHGQPAALGVESAEADSSSLADWPEHRDDADVTPWLLRRLRLCRVEGINLHAALNRLFQDLPR